MRISIKHPAAFIALLLCLPAAQAADCQLRQQLPVEPFTSKPGDLFTPASAPVTTTSYRLGEDFAVKVGDRVLRRQINPAAQSAVFDQPVRYRARLPLTASYALEKGKPYSLLDVPQLAGIHALVLPSLHEGLDEYLFLDAHHQLCARVLLFRREDGKIEYRRNRYRAMPDIAAQVMAGTPDTTRGHGISITLSAMDATRFAFASQASVDGKSEAAQTAFFARSVGDIEFAGFQFRITAIGDSDMRLSVVGEPAKSVP